MINNVLTFICLFVILSCKKGTDPNITTANFTKSTLAYNTIPGVSPNFLSLDIYHYGPGAQNKPVVIYVHGGGFRKGDKGNQLNNKLNLFYSLDYIFISINYRLSPDPSELNNPNRIKFPDHNNDVADAVKWIYSNVGNYGGNPSKIVILGHSAGAHLVSLTGTSQQFLPTRGLPLNTVKGIASFDTEGYDIPSQSDEEIYKNAFGTDNNIHVQASPIYNVANGINYPRFFIAKRGSSGRIALADAFITKLTSAGVLVSQVNGSQYDHEGINNAIGEPGETIITDPLKAFLEQCFK